MINCLIYIQIQDFVITIIRNLLIWNYNLLYKKKKKKYGLLDIV